MAMKLSEMPDSLETCEGLPHVRWDVVYNCLVERKVSRDECDGIYRSLVREWIDLLIDALESDYAVYESEHYVAMLPMYPAEAEPLMEFCENTRRDVIDVVGEPVKPMVGPHVVLLFDTMDELAVYYAYFVPEEGEFRLPEGAFLNRGYKHLVAHNTYAHAMHHTLTHEIIHNMVALRSLPPWLNEGATVILTDVLAHSRPGAIDPRMARRHSLHWNAERIQRFWSGRSFHTPGRASELSYSLAVTICRVLGSTFDSFREFLQKATREDAGEAAAQEVFGISLGDAVAEFLGDGDWAPKPETWSTQRDEPSEQTDDDGEAEEAGESEMAGEAEEK